MGYFPGYHSSLKVLYNEWKYWPGFRRLIMIPERPQFQKIYFTPDYKYSILKIF